MYAELHCKTNYSFLTGGSHADELVARAAELGYAALAVTDINSLAGVVRAYSAVKELPTQLSVAENRKPKTENASLKMIIGAEIIPNDAPPVLLWATDRAAYGNLSQLITVGRRRAPKGECWLSFEDIANHADGLLAGVLPSFPGDRSRIEAIDETHPSYEWFFGTAANPSPPAPLPQGERGDRKSNYRERESPRAQAQAESISTYRELFGDRAWLMASLYQGIDDHWRIEQLRQLSRETGLPLVAAGDVLYHHPSRMPLHDVLTAIKHRTTVTSAEALLLPNAQRHLQSIQRRQQAFASIPDAFERTMEIANQCQFCLSQLKYEYPEELAPDGQTPIQYLRELTERGARQRYDGTVPRKSSSADRA